MSRPSFISVICLFSLVLILGLLVGARVSTDAQLTPEPLPIRTAAPVILAVPAPEPTPEPEPEPKPEPEIVVDDWAAQLIARTIWGEARGCSTIEQAAVAWCILNRVDAEGWAMGRSVEYVVTFPQQFHGYSANNPLDPDLYELAVDVLTRWELEKLGETDVGRVLPQEFLWFHGDGQHNHFRNAYADSFTIWDWSLPDPYIEKESTP